MPKLVLDEVSRGDIGGDLYALSVSEDAVWGTGGTYGTPVVVASSDCAHFYTRKVPESLGLRGHKVSGERIVMVGEYGGLFVSTDRAMSWKKIAVETEGCLFAVAEDPKGAIWVAGDDGFVARSTDGAKTFARVRGLKARVNGIVQHAGRLLFLGHDGTLRAWNGKSFDAPILSAKGPLNGMAVTPEGTLVIVSNGGVAHRSIDGGKRWKKIDLESDADIEAIAWTKSGLIAVGDDGTLLRSEDDGHEFEAIESDSSDHFWTLVPFGTGALIAGENGSIVWLHETGDDTWKDRPDVFAKDGDLTAREDADDRPPESELPPPASVKAAEKPIPDGELRKASERWIREGIEFKKELNAYVRRIYSVGYDQAGDEPTEPRQDMAPLVTRAMVQLNREKRVADLRRLFPAAYEPFDYEDIGQSVGPVFPLDDGRVLASTERRVYAMNETSIDQQGDLITFGVSPDRRFFAKLEDGAIHVDEGWDGKRRHTMKVVKRIWGAGQLVLRPFPDGDRVLLSCEAGIYVVTKDGAEQIYPEKGAKDSLSYPHAAMSRDGSIIALGCQDSAHLLYRWSGSAFSLVGVIDPASEYPHMAGFHDERDYVALCSCHFSRSATLGFDLKHLGGPEKKNGNGATHAAKVLRASEGDKRLDLLDAPRWVWAILPREKGFLLGDRSGYLWYKAFDGALLSYTFIGSTVQSLAQTKDKRKIVASTYAGYVVELDTRSDAIDPHLLTNQPNLAETRRWVFWQGFPPMIW